MNEEIDIFKILDFIQESAPLLAIAKSNRVQLEEFRKSKKAILMKDAELLGHKSAAAQEREAYAHDEYANLITALSNAVGEEERLKWLMVAAQLKIECWRSLESSRRTEARNV